METNEPLKGGFDLYLTFNRNPTEEDLNQFAVGMANNCPRCGEKHSEVFFPFYFEKPFKLPGSERVYHSWHLCPKLNEPFFLFHEEPN